MSKFQIANPNITNLVQADVPANGYVIDKIEVELEPSDDVENVIVSKLVAKACLKPGIYDLIFCLNSF